MCASFVGAASGTRQQMVQDVAVKKVMRNLILLLVAVSFVENIGL
jgi:hypothetical protein